METSIETPQPPATGPLGRLRALTARLHPGTWPVLLGAGAVAGLLIVHTMDPNEPGNYPTCPWLLLTGTWCPGCGSTRAVHALTNLDIAGAAQMNVVLLALLPYILFSYGRWLYRSFRPLPPGAPPRKATPPVVLGAFLVLILVFWAVRNTPFGVILAPGGVPAPAPFWG